MSKKKDFIKIGHKCGSLIIISDPNISKKSGKYWTCQCDCGKQINVSGSQLNPKNKRSIKSCGCRRYEKLKKGTENISGTYICNVIANAKRRKIQFNLTIEYLQSLWEKQNGKCALSGLNISLINKKEYHNQTASLDRIDSSLGYIEGNVQWVNKKMNFMKHSMSKQEFVELCKIVAKFWED